MIIFENSPVPFLPQFPYQDREGKSPQNTINAFMSQSWPTPKAVSNVIEEGRGPLPTFIVVLAI